MKPILKERNAHQRDENLVFDEPTHRYSILTDPASKYTSVTTFNHSQFPHFDADEVIRNMMRGKNWNPANKYWGLTSKEIKAQWSKNAESVSGAGTDLHYQIECFMNEDLKPGYTHSDLLKNYDKSGLNNNAEEWDFFLQFVKAFPRLKPYRTEWMIYHEDIKIAGSIDMVYENPDGTFCLHATTAKIIFLPDHEPL